MAGTTLCVSCASLPLKDRSLAIKIAQCPECKSAFGVTSYGATFRIQPARQKFFLSPTFLGGMSIGAGLFVFVVALTALGLYTKEKVAGPAPGPTPTTPTELARVPEVAVADKFAANIQSAEAKKRISNLITTIRNTNTPDNKDAFVLVNMKNRPELRGLPFVMGDACRLDMQRAQSFQTSVEAVRNGMERDMHSSRNEANHQHAPFWNTYLAGTGNQGIDTDHGVAALSQILDPERRSMRTELVQRLRLSNRPDANKVIARAAVFDADGEVRMAAIKALKDEKKTHTAEVTETLMHGIRYPLAIVAKRSAQAMIMLDRKDLLPQLVDVLGEAAPGDPIETIVNEEKCHAVREVVRINHHRNCLLCHPPSLTGDTQEVPGVIPIPGTPFSSSPKEAYGNARSQGEPMIRADTTYLRQDFSMMMPVENAAPWPEMQRFDFLVRTRPVEGKELAALQQKVQARGADFLSENQKAALRVLSELSGQQNVAPTQAAWQRVIGGGRADE